MVVSSVRRGNAAANVLLACLFANVCCAPAGPFLETESRSPVAGFAHCPVWSILPKGLPRSEHDTLTGERPLGSTSSPARDGVRLFPSTCSGELVHRSLNFLIRVHRFEGCATTGRRLEPAQDRRQRKGNLSASCCLRATCWSGPLWPLSLSLLHRRCCSWYPSCEKGHGYPEGPPPPDSHRGVSRLRDAPEKRILAQRETLATGTQPRAGT